MTKDVTYPLGLVSIYFYHHMDQVKHKQRQIVIKFTCVNLLLSCRIYISSARKANLPWIDPTPPLSLCLLSFRSDSQKKRKSSRVLRFAPILKRGRDKRDREQRPSIFKLETHTQHTNRSAQEILECGKYCDFCFCLLEMFISIATQRLKSTGNMKYSSEMWKSQWVLRVGRSSFVWENVAHNLKPE